MRIRVDQYKNDVYIKDYRGAILIDIRYSGTFIGDMIPTGFVAMNSSRIIIYNIQQDLPHDLFMNYEGNLRIRSIFAYTKDKTYSGVINIESDEWDRISGKWDEIELTWEDYDHSQKYIKDVNTMLSYIKQDDRYYLRGGKRQKTIPAKAKRNEKNILSNLIAKRSE